MPRPKTIKELDSLMFKHIGEALCYMEFNPNFKDGKQKTRVDRMVYDFYKNRLKNYSDISWYKEQVFLFIEETENLF